MVLDMRSSHNQVISAFKSPKGYDVGGGLGARDCESKAQQISGVCSLGETQFLSPGHHALRAVICHDSAPTPHSSSSGTLSGTDIDDHIPPLKLFSVNLIKVVIATLAYCP
ncbi:hypothetical protein PoB_005284600 [Plakobranchus ocellatus]|uniref:Uncharacterized protein n=1 Tax=Plakobranchus ocellatus TaxID=259542 RepID=A0AAV4C4P9_9GAST|nr:hypothetical protein PoB_005284600 [Plakobranchus ocellatus]